MADQSSHHALAATQGSQLVKQVGNTLAVTHKLLANTHHKKAVQLFTQHPGFFKRIVSRYYPLSPALIEKHQDRWDWRVKPAMTHDRKTAFCIEISPK